MTSIAKSRFLLAFDFDHTILDANSDTWIESLLPEPNLGALEDIENKYKNDRNWTKRMASVFEVLYSFGVTPAMMIECLSAAPWVVGMQELLKNYPCDENSTSCDVIILSDSNSFFIEKILESKGLRGKVKEIFTNRAEINANGFLKISPHHSHVCPKCPSNLCKAQALQKFLEDQKQKENKYQTIVYIGDGSNDFCPASTLQNTDFVFTRKGYRLLKKIESYAVNSEITAKVIPWNEGFEILDFLSKI